MSQMRGGEDCPIKPQLKIDIILIIKLKQNSLFEMQRICAHDCIGFDVTNTGRNILVIEKASQAVAYLSAWAIVGMEDGGRGVRL